MNLPTTKALKVCYEETESSCSPSQIVLNTQFTLSDSGSRFKVSQEDTLQSFRHDLISSLRNVVLNSHKSTDMLLENLKKPSKQPSTQETVSNSQALERIKRLNLEELHKCSMRRQELFSLFVSSEQPVSDSTLSVLDQLRSICDTLESLPQKRKAEESRGY